MGEDQLHDLQLDGPTTLRIVVELLKTLPKRNDGCDGRLRSVVA